MLAKRPPQTEDILDHSKNGTDLHIRRRFPYLLKNMKVTNFKNSAKSDGTRTSAAVMRYLLLWYGAILLVAPLSRAQDIVESGVPNVDLSGLDETQRKKTFLAIIRMEMLIYVNQEIYLLESESGEMNEEKQLLELMKSTLASISAGALADCPPDYRQAFEIRMEEIRAFLQQFEDREIDEQQFFQAYDQYYSKCMAIMEPIKEKYPLSEILEKTVREIKRGTGRFKEDKPKLLEYFKALKKEMEQGTFSFPDIKDEGKEFPERNETLENAEVIRLP